MQHVESLEQRRMFAGGIDASFGSSTGAPFDAPGSSPALLDSAVDPAGRVMLAGQTGTPDHQMFLARMHTNGQLDPRFGTGGIIQNTPRGIDHVDQIIPLPKGGYIAASIVVNNITLLALKPSGAVNRAFGTNGIVKLPINSPKVRVHGDGTILVAGISRTRDIGNSDASGQGYIVRLNPDGTLDTTYGDEGWATLGDAVLSDQFHSFNFDLTSLDIDLKNRAIVAFSGGDANTNSSDETTGGSSEIYLQRMLPNGSQDLTFGDPNNDHHAVVFDRGWSAPDPAVPRRIGIAVAMPFGAVAVLSAVPGGITGPATEARSDIFTDSGMLIGAASVHLGGTLPDFSVHTLRQDAIIPLSDQTIMIAGTSTSGADPAPALVHLVSGFIDTSFGTGGMLSLPNANGLREAEDLANNPDGTVTVVSSAFRNEVNRPGDVTVTRVFPEDRPVVSLLKAKKTATQLDVTVSIRGTSAIAPNSLDANDLHIISPTSATKMRLTSFTQNPGGDITAEYHVSLGLIPQGLLSIYAKHGEVLDIHGHGSVGGVIAEVLI